MLIESTTLMLAAVTLFAVPLDDQSSAKQDDDVHISARTMKTDGSVGSVRIIDKNGVRTVWVNDKEVAADLVKEKDGTIFILDEDGNVLHELPMYGGDKGHSMRVLHIDGDDDDAEFDFEGTININGEEFDIKDFMKDGHNVVRLGDEDGDGPRVITVGKPRIGISMGPLDSALAEHLGIDDQGAFIVSDVVKGLPADQAGIRTHDIVVRVNGESASMARLQEIVQGAKEGDDIRIRVIREGNPKDLHVKIDSDAAHDAVGQFEIRVETDSDSDSDHNGQWRFDSDQDFDVDFDGGHVNIKMIKKKIQDAMKDGRFNDWVDRIESIPHLGDMDMSKLHDLTVRLRNAQDLPHTLRLFAPENTEAWFGVAEKLEGALKDLDPQTREKIKESIKKAMSGVHGRLGEWRDHDGPRTFELFQGGGDDDDVIIFHEGQLNPFIVERRSAGGDETVEVELQDNNDNDSDRLRRLEERMERIERALGKIVDRLGDRQ